MHTRAPLGRRALLAAPIALTAPLAVAGCSRATTGDSAAPMVLRLAHSLSRPHPTSVALDANGERGYDRNVLGHQVQWTVGVRRVGSPELASQHAGHHTFGLTYVFDTEEQMHQLLLSEEMSAFYRLTEEQGFVGPTHFTP